MGDRWRPDLLGSSRYIWYPLDFSSGSPTVVHADVWSVNVNAGACVFASFFLFRVYCFSFLFFSFLSGRRDADPARLRYRNLHRRERHVLRGRERHTRRVAEAAHRLRILWRRSGRIPRCVSEHPLRSLFFFVLKPTVPFALGHGGTVTLNNVQGTGGTHWVALYFANGDSTYRNVTVRSVPIPPHPLSLSFFLCIAN